MAAFTAADNGHRFFVRKGPFVRPRAAQRIINIADSRDSGAEGEFPPPLLGPWGSRNHPIFVMVKGYFFSGIEIGIRFHIGIGQIFGDGIENHGTRQGCF